MFEFNAVNNTTKIQLALLICVLLFISAFEVLPKKRHAIIPANNQGLYSNPESKVYWLVENKEWACELDFNNNVGYCGITITEDWSHLVTNDLSDYSAVELFIKASENVNSITMSMRNQVPEISKRGDVESYMFVSGAINQLEFNRPITITLEEFRVAQWWIENYDVPRKLHKPSLKRVSSIGFDIDRYNPAGLHSVEIIKCTFVGDWISRATWYLSALVSWITVSVLQLAFSLIKAKKKSAYNKELLKHMANIQNDLLDENAKIEQQAITDPLTQTLNRFGFEKVLSDLNASTYADTEVSIMLIDIDYFKRINDEYGHNAGDSVIAHTAFVLKQNVRELDNVVRWGGEEFLVCMPNCLSENARLVAEKTRKAIATTKIEALAPSTITVSIGITSYKLGSDFTQALELADKALYQAKRQGRNRVIFIENDQL